MQDPGVYILQWQNPEDQGEFVNSHKAQLMYFYETLPSANYKQVSCQSYALNIHF